MLRGPQRVNGFKDKISDQSRIKQVLMVSDRSFGRFELVEKNVKLNWEQ